MRVFVTGGTGQVGRRLVRALGIRGDEVVVLSRRAAHARDLFGPGVSVVEGDPMQAGAWMDAVADSDAVVNLAGENVFNRRWNAAFKDLLVQSRVQGTRHVAEALARKPVRPDGRPRVLVNASAIGFYGARGNEELDEDSTPGNDFQAHICSEWEKEAVAVEKAGVRCTRLRIGVVLDREGGALAKLLTPFKLFVGGPVAGGRQWFSWIHHEDMTGLILLALDRDEARGPLNSTAPQPVTNRDFSKALGRALHRPSFFPTPGLMLRLAIGEAADVVATGQRVLPRRALTLGYAFKYPTVDAALQQIFA